MEDMEETTCLLIGGAKHAKFFPGCKLEKHHRMIQSLQHDFENIIKFAAEKACKKSTPNGTQVRIPLVRSLQNSFHMFPLYGKSIHTTWRVLWGQIYM